MQLHLRRYLSMHKGHILGPSLIEKQVKELELHLRNQCKSFKVEPNYICQVISDELKNGGSFISPGEIFQKAKIMQRKATSFEFGDNASKSDVDPYEDMPDEWYEEAGMYKQDVLDYYHANKNEDGSIDINVAAAACKKMYLEKQSINGQEAKDDVPEGLSTQTSTEESGRDGLQNLGGVLSGVPGQSEGTSAD